MIAAEHIAEAEKLLVSAKDIARRPKETKDDRLRDETIVIDLLSFAGVHAKIADSLSADRSSDYLEDIREHLARLAIAADYETRGRRS